MKILEPLECVFSSTIIFLNFHLWIEI